MRPIAVRLAVLLLLSACYPSGVAPGMRLLEGPTPETSSCHKVGRIDAVASSEPRAVRILSKKAKKTLQANAIALRGDPQPSRFHGSVSPTGGVSGWTSLRWQADAYRCEEGS